MTFRQYLFWMSVSTALCWAGLACIITVVDPIEAGALGFFLFYSALSLALIGTFLLCGMAGRVALRPHEAVSRHVGVSFRHSLLLTALVAGSLALQSHALLTWWNLLLMIGALILLESVLASFRSSR